MVEFTASGTARVGFEAVGRDAQFDAVGRDAQFDAVGRGESVTAGGFANNFGLNFGR